MLRKQNYRTSKRGQRKAPRRSTKTLPVTNPPLQFIKSGAFMPPRFRTSLRHTVEWSVLADGANHYYYLSGNNCKDPGGSLTATSPPGFQYLAALYERYRTYGSKIDADVASGPNGNDIVAVAMSGTWCVHPTNTNTAFTAVSNAASQPYAKSKAISTQTPQYIRSVMQTSKMVGQKDVLGSDRLQASVGSGPSDEWFWGLNFQTSYNETKTNNLWVRATVTYDVEFFDLSGTLTPALTTTLDSLFKAKLDETKQQELYKQSREALRWSSHNLSEAASKEPRELKDDYTHVDKPKLEPLLTDHPLSSKVPLSARGNTLRR